MPIVWEPFESLLQEEVVEESTLAATPTLNSRVQIAPPLESLSQQQQSFRDWLSTQGKTKSSV
jgi:hypothetical protein